MRLLMAFLFSTISAMALEPSLLYQNTSRTLLKRTPDVSMCWPPAPQLKVVHKAHCDPLVEMMKTGRKKDAPIHFSRHEERGYQLPHRMQWGTCFIHLNFINPGEVPPEEEDDGTFAELAKIVEKIIELCVERIESGGVGGGYVWGKHERMLVFVEGREVPGYFAKNYLPTYLPVTQPPRKEKRPLKFVPPSRHHSHVHDTPQGVVLELPFSLEELEEQDRRLAEVARQTTPYMPPSVLQQERNKPPSALIPGSPKGGSLQLGR